MRAFFRPDVRLAVVSGGSCAVVLALCARALLLPESELHGIDDGVELVMVRGHAFHLPFHVAWALEGLRAHPGRAVGLLAALVLGALGLTFGADDEVRPARRRAHAAIWGGVLFLALSLFLPVDPELNRGFGDGTTLPANVGGGMIFGAEIGTSLFLHLALLVSRELGSQNALHAILAVDAVCALAYGASLTFLAWSHEGSRRDRLLLLLGLLGGGAGLQLLGYVETTQVLLAATATWLSAAVVLVDRRSAGTALLVCGWAALGIAVVAHGAGALLAPSALYLVLASSRPLGRAHFLAGWALVVLPVLLVVLPRWLDGDIGNANGGGDANRWVPLDFDPHDLPSDCVYYGLFDWLHVVDVANAILVACPALVPALALAVLGGEPAWRALHEPGLRLLAWATAGCLVVPLFWNHDFGMWGDWNLAAAYLFPAHVLGWTFLLRAVSPLRLPPPMLAAILVPVFVVQGVGTFGLALQLYR